MAIISGQLLCYLVNVLLFALSCFLLFLLLQRLLWDGIFISFLCALLCAAHPIHTEVVNNIKSADEPPFLFAILASLSALRYAKPGSVLSLAFMVIFYFFYPL